MRPDSFQEEGQGPGIPKVGNGRDTGVSVYIRPRWPGRGPATRHSRPTGVRQQGEDAASWSQLHSILWADFKEADAIFIISKTFVPSPHYRPESQRIAFIKQLRTGGRRTSFYFLVARGD